jgi:hypothetical protein
VGDKKIKIKGKRKRKGGRKLAWDPKAEIIETISFSFVFAIIWILSSTLLLNSDAGIN